MNYSTGTLREILYCFILKLINRMLYFH